MSAKSKTKPKMIIGENSTMTASSSETPSVDPMADMMKKILGQEVATKSAAPVLAKRKTENMKEIELEKGEKKKQKLSKIEKKMNEEKQLVIPDVTTVNFEKSLKKIATRGVVSLFNAIAKAKRADIEENDGGENEGKSKSSGKNKSAKKVDVQALSRDNFVKLLQKSKSESGDKDSKNSSSNSISISNGGGSAIKVSSDSISNRISNNIKNGIKATISGSSSSSSKPNWNVVQDKDLLGSKGGSKTKKGWDEDDDDDDSDSESRGMRLKVGGVEDEDDDMFKEVSDDEGALKMTSSSENNKKNVSKSKQNNNSKGKKK